MNVPFVTFDCRDLKVFRVGDFRDRNHADGFLNHIDSLTENLIYTIEHPSPSVRNTISYMCCMKALHRCVYAGGGGGC